MENAIHGSRGGGKATSPYDENAALAADVFDHFCSATTLKSILGLYRHMCDLLKLRPTNLPFFYPKLKSKLRSWKAQALWKRLDIRANHKCYGRGRACSSTRVLVIGAGPCGLRAAIECQLLGAKVVIIEKRDRLSRNNVLHLWPFVIHDLRALGAKKFFGKFCAGAIDHISIRQLQCILLKVALLLGVEIHEGVSFETLLEPTEEESEKMGWHAAISPADHPVSHYQFDVLIGADGKRNTLDGFKRKEFRGKLAIAITANFINKHSEAEARVQEISGVAFIFNQKFFKDLYHETGIDLENIVYYKDETHYFVMTAKKHSLIDKGVILQDVADTAKLLAPDNVDRNALMKYAREAADFSTNYQMPNLEFAVNHYGQPDVAMFDFTSMYAAENASRAIERNGYRLLMCLVGDSLLEPFWPTGSGCARGFLSCLDACWAIRAWGSGIAGPLEVISERESIYRLLGQTTPENLQRDYAAYTLCPSTRYPNLNRFLVTPIQVRYLYDTDNLEHLDMPMQVVQDVQNVSATEVLLMHKKKRKRDSQVHPDTLLHWIQKQVAAYSVKIETISSSFRNGLALCAIIHRYRPELIDWNSLKPENIAENNQLAFDILEKEMGIPPVMTGVEMAECSSPDKLTMLSYLSQIYETFHGEIPQTIKHLKIDMKELKKEQGKIVHNWKVQDSVVVGVGSGSALPSSSLQQTQASRYTGKQRLSHLSIGHGRRKRRSADKASEEREAEIIQNRNERMTRRRQNRKNTTEQFYKSIHMLHTNAKQDFDPEPFEDYSIYLYRQTAGNFGDRVKKLEQKLLNPDRDRYHDYRSAAGEKDENFSGRVKNIEQKLKHRSSGQEKKPPDLLRAIGKIDSSDWNVREIEKKILENKLGKNKSALEKEKVPKWSREQFVARQTKMERKANLERNDSVNEKYVEIDKSLKVLEKKLKEGSALEQGHRKVASMAEHFDVKSTDSDSKNSVLPKSNSKTAINLPAKGGSEICHFCGTRVYLMERLSAEGRFFHRGCFRCQYCSINLRLGFYVFDAQHGNKFYCPQHAGMQGKTRNIEKSKSSTKMEKDSLDAKVTTSKGHTPERIEFANLLLSGHVSENEEPPSQMDEDEWTDRNFGQSTAELDSSDLSDSDSDDLYEEALERAAGEVQLNSGRNDEGGDYLDESPNSDNCDSSDDESSYYDYSSDADGNDSVTDEEELKLAREIRRREFNVQERLIPADTDTTGSDTEVIISISKLDNNSTDLTPIPEHSVELTPCDITPVENNAQNEKTLDNVNSLDENNSLMTNSSSDKTLDVPRDTNSLDNNETLDVGSDTLDKNNMLNETKSLEESSHLEVISDKENKPDFGSDQNLKCNKESDIQILVTEETPTEEKPNLLNGCDNLLTADNLSYLSVSSTDLSSASDDDSFANLLKSTDIPSDVDLDFLEELDRTEKAIKVKEELKEKNLLPSQLLAMRTQMNERKLRERRNSVDPQYASPLVVKPLAKLDNDVKKYFGQNVEKPKPPPVQQQPKPKDEEVKKLEKKYSFEPNDEDLDEIENYIESLMTCKSESEIPVPEVPSAGDDSGKPLSDSIEDLFKALETETTLKNEITDVISGVHTEKINDLLNWMDDLDHTPLESKLYRSYSGAKYSKLEKHLKSSPRRVQSVVSKMPRHSIELFENMIAKSESKSDVAKVESSDVKNTSKLPMENIKIFEKIKSDEKAKSLEREIRKDIPRNVVSYVKEKIEKSDSRKSLSPLDDRRKERSVDKEENLKQSSPKGAQTNVGEILEKLEDSRLNKNISPRLENRKLVEIEQKVTSIISPRSPRLGDKKLDSTNMIDKMGSFSPKSPCLGNKILDPKNRVEIEQKVTSIISPRSPRLGDKKMDSTKEKDKMGLFSPKSPCLGNKILDPKNRVEIEQKVTSIISPRSPRLGDKKLDSTKEKDKMGSLSPKSPRLGNKLLDPKNGVENEQKIGSISPSGGRKFEEIFRKTPDRGASSENKLEKSEPKKIQVTLKDSTQIQDIGGQIRNKFDYSTKTKTDRKDIDTPSKDVNALYAQVVKPPRSPRLDFFRSLEPGVNNNSEQNGKVETPIAPKRKLKQKSSTESIETPAENVPPKSPAREKKQNRQNAQKQVPSKEVPSKPTSSDLTTKKPTYQKQVSNDSKSSSDHVKSTKNKSQKNKECSLQ